MVGGKSAKFLAHKLCKQQTDSTVNKIRNVKTQTVENKLERIQKSSETFYRTLYSQPQAPEENHRQLFENLGTT